MAFYIICTLALVTLAAVCTLLWKRVELLLTAVSRLASAQAETDKFVENMLRDFNEENELIEKRITKAEKQFDDLPIEQLKAAVQQENEFMEGLNNILSYSVGNHGINKDGVKHE